MKKVMESYGIWKAKKNTNPVIQLLEGKDDALHEQLMRTTSSSLDEYYYCILGQDLQTKRSVKQLEVQTNF